MNILLDSLIDGTLDTLKMIPLLLIVFIALEFLEFKYGKELNNKVKLSGKLGPIVGAILGVIPQCGISVLAVGFYSKSLITLGTLISIFIATSDEAIPILLAKPTEVKLVLPLILTKLVLGVILGYLIDFIFGKSQRFKLKSISNFNCNYDCCHSHNHSHDNCDESNHYNKYIVLINSLKKLIKISFYIFIITFILNIIFELKEITSFLDISSNHIVPQILITSLVGLIPNCATSVALVEVFLRNGIVFSSLIAGLSSNAGLGLLILFKNKKNRKPAFNITILLYICAVTSGFLSILLQHFI